MTNSEPTGSSVGEHETGRHLTVEELAAQQGVRPIESIEEPQLNVFDTDEEVQAFLAEVRLQAILQFTL